MLLQAKVTEFLGDKLALWQVCVIGVGIVFLGLVCLIIICSIMGVFFKGKKQEPKKPQAIAPKPQASESLNIPNRQEFIAAVSAVIAEELGKDISGIKIVSIKKV